MSIRARPDLIVLRDCGVVAGIVPIYAFQQTLTANAAKSYGADDFVEPAVTQSTKKQL